MPRKVHGARGLLNLPGHHSTAAIVAEIEDTSTWIAGKGRGGEPLSRYTATPEATLVISDCENKVNIELDLDSDNNLRNSLYKLDTIINSLRKARRGLIIEAARYKRRERTIPEDRKYGL